MADIVDIREAAIKADYDEFIKHKKNLDVLINDMVKAAQNAETNIGAAYFVAIERSLRRVRDDLLSIPMEYMEGEKS